MKMINAVLIATLVTSGGAGSAQALSLATWNLEWLMTTQTYDQLAPHCDKEAQPRSDERRFPCTAGHPPVPRRRAADFDALARIAETISADVVALQEVDGPVAGALVFRSGWTLACFSKRQHPQKVGFAIRAGIPFNCNPELAALDVDGYSRSGADVTLYPGTTQQLRLLAVHLKSGCFAGPLSKKGSCPKLREQIPVLERWLDERAQHQEAFAILGDFNRRLEKDSQYPAGPDELAPTSMFAALSDRQPKGAVLLRATQYLQEQPCSSKDRYLEGAIDNILVSQSLAARAKILAGRRISYTREDVDNFILSDHCPMIFSLEK